MSADRLEPPRSGFVVIRKPVSNASLSMNASEIFGLFDLKAKAGKGTKTIGPENSSSTEGDKSAA
jgi:hypothetical protein